MLLVEHDENRHDKGGDVDRGALVDDNEDEDKNEQLHSSSRTHDHG